MLTSSLSALIATVSLIWITFHNCSETSIYSWLLGLEISTRNLSLFIDLLTTVHEYRAFSDCAVCKGCRGSLLFAQPVPSHSMIAIPHTKLVRLVLVRMETTSCSPLPFSSSSFSSSAGIPLPRRSTSRQLRPVTISTDRSPRNLRIPCLPDPLD